MAAGLSGVPGARWLSCFVSSVLNEWTSPTISATRSSCLVTHALAPFSSGSHAGLRPASAMPLLSYHDSAAPDSHHSYPKKSVMPVPSVAFRLLRLAVRSPGRPPESWGVLVFSVSIDAWWSIDRPG